MCNAKRCARSCDNVGCGRREVGRIVDTAKLSYLFRAGAVNFDKTDGLRD